MIDKEENKKTFIEELNKLNNIHGANISSLIDYLESTKFFDAPATTKYKGSYEGGLCEHSLNVLKNMRRENESLGLNIDDTSIIVVALLHDIYKATYFEQYVKNTKVYHEGGKKQDELGKFDWVSEHAYRVKDAEDRFVTGDNGTTSYIIVSRYIPLLNEETIAIKNCELSFNANYQDKDMHAVLAKYPLLVLLIVSDTIDTYVK